MIRVMDTINEMLEYVDAQSILENIICNYLTNDEAEALVEWLQNEYK